MKRYATRACIFAICAAGLLAGCSGSAESSAPVATGSLAPSHPYGLRVTDWAVNDGLLSVVVHNDSNDTIRSARALITAKDAHGNIIASYSSPLSEKCCTVIELPPGRSFGLYADLGPSAARTSGVSVNWLDVSLERDGNTSPRVAVKNISLTTGAGTATVQATFTLQGSGGPYVAGQAFLTDSSGKFVSLISGRFYCFVPGQSRTVRMVLFHPVPAGTRVQRVVGFPLAEGLPGTTVDLPDCTTSRADDSTPAAPARHR